MKRRRLTSLLLTGIMMLQTVSPALAVQPEAYAASAAAASSHAHPVCGSSCSCASSHKSSDWTAWDGTTKMYDGNYYLTQDIELDSTMILDYGYSTNLCLNGHSITCEDTVFNIYSYRSLLISDCVGTGKIETTNADYTITNNKYLSIWGGTILNSSDESESIAAICAYSGTNTFVCGGRVEGANALAIYAYPGSKINVKGGTVHADSTNCSVVSGHSTTSGVVGSMTVSGGSITGGSSGRYYPALDIQNGDFTMTGGYVGGSVYVYEGSADISGGTIDGFVNALEMTVTGGNMEINSWSPAEINAGTFRGTCYLYGTDTVITGGDFSACDQTIVRGDTWICGGRFGQIRVGNAPLYLSGVPEIDVLMAEYPGMISAQNIDGSGSYGGSTIDVILADPQSASDWEDGDIVVKNVTSDAVAAKFALAGVDAEVYSLVRSGSNLILRVLPHGTWGDNVNWKLDNGTLTISGTGVMDEALSGEHYPWGQHLNEIREIVVEPGITEIPRYAFEYCEYARSIRLPETLQSLSLNAFNDCGSLNNLLLPASLASISGSSNTGRPSFIRCESLTDVYYLGTAEEWNGVANANQVMSSDSEMTMHWLEYHESTATCTEAGTQAHYRFDNTSVYGTYDTAKQPISQPGVVPALGHDWMDGTPRTCAVCGAAEIETVASGVCGDRLTWVLYADGTLVISGTGPMRDYDYYFVYGNGYFAPWASISSQIKTVLVEEGVTRVGDNAFGDCRYLTDISLPDSLESIGFRAFYNCDGLTDVVIPNGVTALENSAFYECAKLRNVTLSESLTVIEDYAFEDCPVLQDMTFPESLTTIGKRAFALCRGLRNVIFPQSVRTIGASAFVDCNYLHTVQFDGDAPLSIGDDAFLGINRATAYYPGENSTWTGSIMQNYGGTLVWTPYGYCGAEAGGRNLRWHLDRATGILTISGTGKMDDYRYDGEDVPWAAYRNEIRAVSLGDGVTGIGAYAFLDCTLVTTLEIAAGITGLNATAFKGCTGLTGFTVDSANTAYHAVDGVVFSADNSTVVAYPTGRAGAYVIPDGTTLGGGSKGSAFDYAQGLTKVTIPDGLQFKSYGAFNECTNLTEVYCLGDFPFESVFKSFSTGSAVSWDGSHTFRGVTATVYYPEGNSTWTSNKMVNMGGTITYVPYTPGGSSAPEVSFAGGSGTADDPYQVETAEQLDHVRYHLDEHFIQTADIDLNGMDWTPIGTAAESFNGTYDGNGREIYNLTIDVTTTYAEADTHAYGLFGVCGSESEIARLTVNCYIDVEYTDHIPMGESVSVGAVCGVTAGELWELVVNGSVNVLDRPTVGTMYVGGVAGRSSALITECINNATLQAGAEFVYVGGIVGSTTGNITHCETASYVMITVHGAMSVYVGGICGSSEYPLPGMMMIENCTNRACINARVGSDVGYVGGIVGYTTGGCTDCINANGEALDHELTGSASALYIAGIAAYSQDKMMRCTNTGAVRADTEACYGMGTITAAGICAVGAAAACTNRGSVSATGQNYAEAYGIATSVAYASAPAPSVNYGKVTAYSADQTGRAYGIAKEDFVSGAVNCGAVEATGMDAYASGIGGSTYVHQACNLGSVTARAKMYEAEAAGISTDAAQFTMIANAGDIFAYDGTTIYAAGITTNNVISVGCNMYNAGDVTAEGFENAYAGGILADLYGVVSPTSEYVKNVYNVGKITASGERGNSYAGALVAHMDDSNDQIDLRNTAYIKNGYYLTGSAAAAVSNDTRGVALSGYEMTQQTSFAGFDFYTDWSIDPEADYPFPVLQGLDIPMPKVDVDLNPPQSPGNDPQITSFWILGVEYTDFTTWENENHHVLIYPCNLTQPQNPEDISVTVDDPGVTDVRVTLLEDYNPQYWSLVLIKDGREISHVLELAQPPHEGGDTIFTWVREDATGAYWPTVERFCTGCGMLMDSGAMEVSNEILVAPSCTSDGLIRFSATVHYSETDEWHSDTGEAVMPATGHLPGAAVEENRVEPSAAADGSYDSVVYCQTCAAELSRETVVLPATGIDIVASGMLTDSITWTLDSNGTLTISGQGAIPDYDECSPWADYENILRICIEDGITRVGDHAIRDLHQLRSVTMADSVTELGNHAFTYCYELSEVHLSGNLTTIGPYAFYWDSALEEVEIPETVVSIGEFAFAVYGLTKIAIPASVTNIGCGAFTYSGRLTELTVAENNDTYTAMGNVLYTKGLIKTLVLSPTSVAVGEYTVADGVNSIASRAFQGCYDLTSVTIPASVSDLGGNVFADCGSLKEIRFQGDAPAFQNNTFSGIEATVYYPAGNATWTEAVRQNYEGSITWVATGIDIIDSGMLTDSITWTLDSNGTLTISGQGAIPDYAGYSPWGGYEDILRVRIEDGITRVGDHALRDIPQLRSVTMADSVTELGDFAFAYCYMLSDVKLSENLTGIESFAFYWNEGLTELVIPEKVTSISYAAFAVMHELTSVTIPASVGYIGPEAFTSCSKLTNVTVAEENPVYTSRDNVVYTKDLKTLVLCPGGIAVGEYTVLDGVIRIEDRAFQGCFNLTSVVLPASVTELGAYVFMDCGSLTEIRFQGDAPAFQDFTFSMATMTAYYPAGNATWTEYVRQNYEGTITWVATGIDIVASGMLTDSITWTLDSDGTLTISGQGAIPDYDWYSPWAGYEDILRVRIEDGITRVGDHALRDIPQLRSVTMADSVTELGDYAFAYCYMLSDVKLSENLTGIESFAFYWNEGLTELAIPEKVTSISDAAFAVMHELTSVTIPASVSYIGPEAFTSCSKLTNVTVAEENPAYTSRDNVVYTKDLKTLVLCPGGIAVGEYTVLDGVTRIEDRAFQGCFNLTSVVLPASVTELGAYVFMDCGSLTEIRFRGDAPAFQDFTFSMATMTAYYPAGNATWTEYVRQNYEGSITWVPYSTAVASGRWGDIFWSWDGEGTLTISGEGAVPGINEFAGMDGSSEQPWAEYMQSITRVVLEEGITGIGQSAFMFHSQLAEVEFPSTLERIGVCAFAYCNSLRQVNLPESLKTLEAVAFDATGLTSVRIPAAVETVGMGVFEYCYNLTEVVIDAPIRAIPDQMFYYSQALPGFEIPETVESIGQKAFGYCFALEDITIPAGVTVISSRAFEACSGLKTITFEGDAPAIAEDAFDSTNNPVEATAYYPAGNATWTEAVRRNYGAESIVWVAVGGDPNIIASGYCGGEGDGTNLTWTLTTDGTLTVSGTGAMMDGNTTSWMTYLSSIKTVVIEEGVTTLGSNAFSNCRALERITLPDTLTAIGMAAFTSCASLTDIEIPAGVRVIDAAAFSNCSSLSEILLPDGLESIYVSAFSNCTALQSITIPAGVTGIGNDVFRGCSALKRITFPGAAPYINGTAFSGVGTADAPATVYYPAGDSSWDGVANQNYGGTLIWVTYVETVASGTIGETLRWTLDSTGTLTISGEGEMPNFFWNFEDAPMGHLWFDYRDLVRKIVVEEGITRIGECAFSRHTNVTAVELPESLTEIGNYAFEDCIGLTEIQFPAGLTRICDYAFYNCDGLTTLDVPDLVYEIGQFAFCGCDNLVTVHVGSGISHLAPACFIDCPALETIWVNAPESQVGHDGTSFSNAEVIFLPGEAEGFTWSYDETTCTLTISGSGESVLPIKNAPWQEYANQMGTLIIGDGITELGAYTFAQGDHLSEVYIGKDVERLSTYALSNCMMYNVYFLGDQPQIVETGVTQPFAGYRNHRIYYSASKDWDESAWTESDFRSVPGEILDANALSGNLTWIVDDSGTLSFFDRNTSETLSNAAGTTMPWSNYTEIIHHADISSGVTFVGAGVFDSCTNLKTVYIDSCREDVTLAANAFDEDVTVRFKTCRTHSFDGGSTCTFCGADKCEALGHDYGEVQYHWGADYVFCTATRTCRTDVAHQETVWAQYIASVVSVPATCVQMGTTTYAAVFKETWTTTQMISAVNIATIAHTPAAAVRENEVAATCAAAGSYDSVVYCSVCKTHEISRETISVEKLEHTYDQQLVAPMYLKKAATCEQAAIYYYSCSGCGAKGSETFTSGEARGHDYGTVSYTWSENSWACTATRVCRRDANHTETASAHVTASMIQSPSCVEKGVYMHSAIFSEPWATSQSKAVETDYLWPHVPAEAVKENEIEATCTTDGSYDSVVYCSYCKVYEFSRETVTVEKLGHSGAWITTKVPTFTEEGEEMRVCTRDAAHVEKRTIEKIPAVSYEMETGYVGVIERLPPDAYGMMVALYLNGRMLSCNIGGELVMTLPDLLQQADTLKVYYIDEGYQPVTHAGVIKLK